MLTVPHALTVTSYLLTAVRVCYKCCGRSKMLHVTCCIKLHGMLREVLLTACQHCVARDVACCRAASSSSSSSSSIACLLPRPMFCTSRFQGWLDGWINEWKDGWVDK